MAGSRVEFADWAGVDSRSSPLRLPPGRALRNQNWRPMPNGILQLRHGYSKPQITPANPTIPIHSAAYYELHNGSQQVLYSQNRNFIVTIGAIPVLFEGSAIKIYSIAGGGVTDL